MWTLFCPVLWRLVLLPGFPALPTTCGPPTSAYPVHFTIPYLVSLSPHCPPPLNYKAHTILLLTFVSLFSAQDQLFSLQPRPPPWILHSLLSPANTNPCLYLPRPGSASNSSLEKGSLLWPGSLSALSRSSLSFHWCFLLLKLFLNRVQIFFIRMGTLVHFAFTCCLCLQQGTQSPWLIFRFPNLNQNVVGWVITLLKISMC